MAERSRRSGEETRTRILDAAFETLKADGYNGASARAIAQRGEINPTLLFYHFGTVKEVLLESVRRASARRVVTYQERLEQVDTLPDLVTVAAELHDEDVAQGYVLALAQMVAGASTSAELGPRLGEIFDPWIELVTTTLSRVTAGTALEGLIPTADAAFAVTALFLGLELLTHLGGDFQRSKDLFASFEELADLAGALLALTRSGD